jgi:hypothetical protein
MMELLGLMDMAIIGAVVAAMEIIKHADAEKKWKRFYPLFVLVLGLLAAVSKTQPLVWQQFLYNAMIYVAVPSYVFKFGKTTLLGK